jgi:putative tryptophan/tyrosine transport system substrate-binding protein
MDRRRFVLTSLAGALAAPLAVEGQQAGRGASAGPRVGFLGGQVVEYEAFRAGLQDLGWRDGQNLTLIRRSPADTTGGMDLYAEELVHLPVAILVVGSLAARAAKSATATIPTVFVIADDPVASGFVATLAQPGGNMTGVTSLNVELDAKRAALLKEAVPSLSRISVLFNRDHNAGSAMLQAMERAAATLRVRLDVVEVRSTTELDSRVASVFEGRGEAVAVMGAPFFFRHQARIADLALRNRLPGIAPWRPFSEAGGLLRYGTDVPAMYRRAAVYVDKILRGAQAADLPVEQPTRFELVINLKTARTLGLTIPPSLLARADRVIE